MTYGNGSHSAMYFAGVQFFKSSFSGFEVETAQWTIIQSHIYTFMSAYVHIGICICSVNEVRHF